MQWTVETLDVRVDAELDDLPVSLRARLTRMFELIEMVGAAYMREPHVKHIEGRLWEIRAKASDGIARALYVTTRGNRLIVVHVFAKKSSKTPRRALRIARERLREVKP